MTEGAFPSDPIVDAPLSVAAPEPEDTANDFPPDPIVDAPPTAPLGAGRVPPYRAGQEPPVIPERQWSFAGTALPDTEAYRMGETIHPLSRAVLQNFDLTSDIDSNRAAIEQIVAKTYPGLNREILSGYPDDRLRSILETPKLRRALALDSATRERLAKNAEEAAILRNEIPLMMAAEGAIATYTRMMLSAEDRTPEAMVKRRRDVGTVEALVEAPIRSSVQAFWGIYGEAESSRLANQATYAGRPSDAFVNAYKEWSLMGDEQFGLVKPFGVAEVIGKLRAGASAAFDAAVTDPEDAAELSRRSVEVFNLATEKIIEASKNYPLPKDVQALIAGLPKVDGLFEQTQTIAYLSANPVATAKWAAITAAEGAPGIAAGGAATLLGQPTLGLTLMTMFNATRELAAITDPELIKSIFEKTGIDLGTSAGRAEYARKATPAALAARQESKRFRSSRATVISALSLSGIKIASSLKSTRSMTLNVSRATGVNVLAETMGELFAGRIATGEFNYQEALLEGILGSGPLMTTLELGVAGRADVLKRAEATKLEEWLRGNEEVRGIIAGIPVEKLDTAASVLADKMAAEGNPDVFLSAENLLRFDQDGDAIGTLGFTREEVEQAAAEGQDVQIDAQTFIRHILGKDGFDSLIRHTTFEEGALTPDEAERSVEEAINIEAALNEKLDSMLGPELTKPVLDKLVEDASAIRSSVAEQLKATGRYDADKSDAFALLTASRYTARAVRIARETGQPVDAAALFEADNLQIVGGQPAVDNILEQGRIRSVWDKLRGKDSSSSVVTLRHGGPALEGGKLDLEFTGRANDPNSTSPRETTGVYFSTEGGTQATLFSSTRSGSRVRRLYEARLPAESLSGVVDFMSGVSDLSPEMQQTLADLAAEAGIEVGRGEIAGNLIARIRSELENGTERLVEAGISGHETKSINEMVIWDQALLDSAELFDVTEGDPVQLRQSAKEFGVSAEVLKAELDAVGGDITQTPRFKEWFKQGKLLDAEGKPLALFHRTEADIEAFVPGGPNLPDNYRGDDFALSGRAVFLSTDPAAPEANFRIGDQGGENVLPVYSSLQNPFYYDPDTSEFAQDVYAEGDPAPGEFPRLISDAAIARLKEDGHDGVVVQDADGNISEVLVFDPAQIKSVFNQGAFDPASDNILEQSDIDSAEVELSKGFKDERIPELEEAARQRSAGEITQEAYDAKVNELKPIRPYTSVPVPATVGEMKSALKKGQQGRVGQGSQFVGEDVGMRLDIPAYTNHGTWVPTMHNPAGKPIAHEAAAQISDVVFTQPGDTAERKAARVGTGEVSKSPFAQMNGTLQSVDPDQLAARAAEVINDPEWTQVGYDPRRHTFFYDRATQQPVLSADEVIQVGPLVLAKNVQFGAGQSFLFQDSVENKRETKQDERVADKNAHGLMPYLRDYSEAEPRRTKKQALGQTTTNKNARKQLDQVDEILELNPDAHTSAEAWLQMMADAYGTQDVPIAPYRFIEEINGTGAVDNLSRLSEGQIEDANHGFENAAAFREAYTSGKLGVETTAKLFLWSFLSRGVSPYTQEALFIDAFPGIDVWMDMASEGTLDMEGSSANFDLGDKSARDKLAQDILAAQTKTYKALKPAQRKKANAPTLTDWRLNDDGTVNLTYPEWVKTVAPAGSGQPGAGSTHNLNAFGKDFLVKMSQDVGDGTGRSRLQYLHDLMSDPESTGQQVRREFAALGEGVGIDNKVVSFTLLVAGYNDVLVLDRVQFRQLYNDGRFDGVNIYDGFKEDGKAVTASGFSKQGDGARGILIYEAMERAVAGRIDEIYTELGREGEGSVGRYHWETWVADSQQEASHGSLGAILPAALGDNTAINKVSAKQGEYGSYAYGARYGVDGAGIGYFTYPTPNGNVWLFTIDQFVEFQQEVRKARNGVVPTKFKVTEAGNAPWYTSEEVNVENLDQLAESISSGKAGDGAGTLFQDGADQLISDRLPADPALEQRDLFQEVDFVGDVIFEVAPDPNNVELSARWNALPPAAQLAISDTVSKSVLPSVLEAAGAEGSVSPQIGSYLDDTNPSFSLRLTSGDPAAVANAVGFVLSQDEMVALSADAFDGSFEAGAVRIQIGDKSLQEIDGIYQTLRGIEGFPQIGGQSTIEGQMTLILAEGVDRASFAEAVDKALTSAYSIETTTVNAAFPEKKDYDYARERDDPAGAEGLARQRYRDVRVQASQELAAAIDQYERGGQQPAAFEQQRGAAGPRGGFTPSDLITDQEGKPVNLLQIFEKADPTTFLHESGHFWLEQLKADALAVGGGFQQDFKAVTDWWASRPLELREEAVRRAKKKKDKDSVAALQQMTEAQVSAYARSGELRGEGPSRYLSVAMHEQFARGVENYFATGRAPSLALGSIFSQFKVWVGSVYNRFMKLDVQFSPEVTGVVDRMLASDEEITVVEGQYNMAPLLQTAEQAGMTPTQFAAYQKGVAEAGEARRAKQLSKANRDHRRTLTKWWEESEDAMRPEVEQEVAALPVYRLMYAITELGLADGSVLPDGEAVPRMDKAALAEVLEIEGYALADMPRVGSKTLYMEGGEAPAIVAAAFGYEDVVSMIAELTAVAPYADAVAAAVKARMEDRYGTFDSMYEAVDSAHIDKTAQVLAAELQALRTTEPAFKQKFVRQYARERLLDATTGEIRPFKYIQAEKKHADLAGAALKRGDRTAAYKHQFHRLVNHYMSTEALKAQRDVDKKRTYMEGFSKRNKKFPSIEAEYVDVIKSILKSVNFKTGAAGKAERTVEIAALEAFIETRQEQDGALLTVPDFLLDPETNPNNNIRGMSYRRFLQLHEVIKRYDTQGRNAKRARKGEDAVELSRLTAELLTTLAARKDSLVSRFRSKSASEENITGWKGLSFLAAVDGQLLKIEALLEAMDGSVLGPWHQSLYEPFSEAAAQSQELQLVVSDMIGSLVASLPRSVKKNFGKGISPSLLGGLGKPGMRITRGNLVMLALNAGNEGNLDKVIRGLGGDVDTKVTGAGWNINEDILNTAFEQLTEEEWSLIRTVWAHAEKLWPTVDAIYRKEHGLSPDRVEPRTITTKFGDITGGYFPLMYDKTVAGASADAEQKDALQLMQAQAGRASVNSSMTKARTGYAAPVTLNINKLASSFRNTIHFITHYEAVQNANKILNQPEIKAAIEIKVGSAYYRELRAWLAALAVNSNDTTDLGAVGEFFNQIYTNTTVAILGASYTTLGMQTLGIINGQDRILADAGYTPKNTALLQKDMAYGAMKALDGQHARWIMEASGEMRFRRDNIDQNVDEALRSLKGKTSVLPAVQRTAMQAIAQVQFYSVDMPVWTAAYNTSLRSHPNDTPRAVKYADRVIRLSQSAGALKDLSPIQRKAYLKPFLMFYTWFAAWYATQRGLGAEFGANITKRPAAAVARAATRMFVLLALTSVGVGLVRGKLPDWEEEDPETGETRYAMLDFIRKESLSTFTGSIPVLREITSGWASGFGYSGGAGTIAFESVEALLSTVAKEVPQLFSEDEDAEVPDEERVYSDAAKKLAPYIMLLGVMLGVPAVQVNRTLGGIANLFDEVEGASPMDVLLGPANEDELRRRLEN